MSFVHVANSKISTPVGDRLVDVKRAVIVSKGGLYLRAECFVENKSYSFGGIYLLQVFETISH